MKKIFMIAICLFSINILAQQTTTSTFGNENYVHNVTFLFPFSLGQENNATNTQKLENITYFDGLGRPIQQISIRQSPLLKDIVTHIEYDSLGRKSKSYLPYVTATSTGLYRTDALTKTNAFYDTPKYQNTTNPYSEKFFDNSPLGLVVESAAPGNAWKEGIVNEHTVKNEYKLVETSDNVYNLQVALGATNTLINKGLYSVGHGQVSGTFLTPNIYKLVTKNENWKATDGNNNTVHTFKDFRGRIILKRTFNNDVAHDTYYVYDNYNNLSFVIPPKVTISNGVDATELSELCYQYRYDEKNRLIEKKIPGKGWEYIIYDNLDRPVLTQDANQRDKNGDGIINDKDWLFTKYDKFGRVAYTGIYTHASVLGRAAMQSYFDTQNNSAEKSYEIKEESLESLEIYYSNNDFPNTSLEVLTVNYYDNYVFDRAGLGLPSSIGTVYGKNITTNAKGLSTGSRIRVLGTNDWITTITYYDEKAQPIYVYSKNSYLETTDIVESKLSFTGKVLETKSIHKKTGKEDIVTIDTFTYDHANRLLDHNQCVGDSSLTSCSATANSTDITFSSVLDLQTPHTIVDNNSITLLPGFHAVAQTGQSASFSIVVDGPELIASNTYDELGQLENKKVGNTSSNPLQTVDYKYNIRGWLTDINQDAKNDNDLFNFSLKYNNPTSGTALYNGNISQASWNTLSQDTSTKTYTYTYDDLDRIKSAISSNANYNLDLVTYDKNGNILSLKRQGHTNNDATLFGVMDNLVYSYTGNQLKTVSDIGNTTFGFKDGANNSVEYAYDVNGNMKIDDNKGIAHISYNHLNLPTTVNIGGQNINYMYAADGTKLRKYVNGVNTDYAGNYIYKDNNLQFFSTPEGYFNVTSTSGTVQGDYVYQYKDHLGNVRLSYSDAAGTYKSIVESDFENSFDVWEESGTVNYTLENGRLKVNVQTQWEGIKYLHPDVVPGETYTARIKFDKGNTQSIVRFYIVEYDQNNTLIGYKGLNYDLPTGDHTFSYTASSNAKKIRIYLDKDNTHLTTETQFYVDYINFTKGKLEIIEESNYYPFGLKHKGYNSTLNGGNALAQKFGFTGKELQDDLVGGSNLNWHDFGARNYDATLGRWMNLDPLAEQMRRHSPYNYALNNPVFFIDPDGMAPFWFGDPVKNPRIRSTQNSGRKGGMFGMTRSKGKQFHNGVDILAPVGTPIQSIKDGTVFSLGTHQNLGNFVIIKTVLPNGSTLFTAYSHLNQPTPLKSGAKVKEGSIVGQAGKTGNAKGMPKSEEHVHIYTKVSANGKYSTAKFVDPLQFFDTKFDANGNPVRSVLTPMQTVGPQPVVRTVGQQLSIDYVRRMRKKRIDDWNRDSRRLHDGNYIRPNKDEI